MLIETIDVERIDQAIDLGLKMPGGWFRGHPKCIGRKEDLLPQIFRKSVKESLRAPDSESNLCIRFQSEAQALENRSRWAKLVAFDRQPT